MVYAAHIRRSMFNLFWIYLAETTPVMYQASRLRNDLPSYVRDGWVFIDFVRQGECHSQCSPLIHITRNYVKAGKFESEEALLLDLVNGTFLESGTASIFSFLEASNSSVRSSPHPNDLT